MKRAADIKKQSHVARGSLWFTARLRRVPAEEELCPPKIKPQDTVTSPPVNKVPTYFGSLFAPLIA